MKWVLIRITSLQCSLPQYRWVHQRKAFEKPLVSQPVVRNKLAAIISRVESAQSWLENITYQMCNMVCSLKPNETIDCDANITG